jgi:hypothetical protein
MYGINTNGGAVVQGTAERPIDVVLLTSDTFTISGGEHFVRKFTGAATNTRGRADLGAHVTARLMGNVLASNRGCVNDNIEAIPTNTDSPYRAGFYSNYVVPVISFLPAACNAETDASGLPSSSPRPNMRPNVLLNGWYDHTVWQDFGLAAPRAAWPLGTCLKPRPVWQDKATWRDVMLEHAIVN